MKPCDAIERRTGKPCGDPCTKRGPFCEPHNNCLRGRVRGGVSPEKATADLRAGRDSRVRAPGPRTIPFPTYAESVSGWERALGLRKGALWERLRRARLLRGHQPGKPYRLDEATVRRALGRAA